MTDGLTALNRRELAYYGTAGMAASFALLYGCAAPALRDGNAPTSRQSWLYAVERTRIVRNAARWLDEPPRTITATVAPRSPGDAHAYYSEGDYWWPDPANPDGAYIRRDGLSNPDRFDAHRQALIRFSQAVPALTAGWMMTRQHRFAEAATAHLVAWFVNADSKMAPHLNHAQAIIGVNSGRGIGIIDTLHLVEVALSVRRLPLGNAVQAQIISWFESYLDWLWTSPNGLDEQDEVNNHGTCYALQVAAFAMLTGDGAKLDWCREVLVHRLIPAQVAADGRQPLELARTKPFGYSLFNLDALAMLAQLSAPDDAALWTNRGPTGGSLSDALHYMAPFIADKSTWPHARDVEYWDDWPVRHPALIIGGLVLQNSAYVALWQRLDADPVVPEIIRNYPARQPLLWL